MIYFRTGAVTIELLLLVGIAAALIEAFTRIGHSPASRSRMRAGDTMLYLTAFVFVGSGVSKFLHVDLAVVELTLLRLTGIKYGLVAALEILCGLLLLVRFLRSVARLEEIAG